VLGALLALGWYADRLMPHTDSRAVIVVGVVVTVLSMTWPTLRRVFRF